MCKYKGKSEEACQNYIRVLAKKAENKVFVCGTNAYKPKCREYLENVSERKKIGSNIKENKIKYKSKRKNNNLMLFVFNKKNCV